MNLNTVKWAQCGELKNCSSKCAYDWAQLQYTIQHRTVLIIFLPLDNHHSSYVVYCRRREQAS